jgi:hypothetical protein
MKKRNLAKRRARRRERREIINFISKRKAKFEAKIAKKDPSQKRSVVPQKTETDPVRVYQELKKLLIKKP